MPNTSSSSSASVSDYEEDTTNHTGSTSSTGQDSASAIPNRGVRWSSDETASSISRTSGDDNDKEDNDKEDNTARRDKVEEEEEEEEPEDDEEPRKNKADHDMEEPPAKKSKGEDRSLLNDMQRRLRNAREKKRSGKICDQFDQIRDAMVAAGVIVPKGTKGTILAAAKEYIAMLQEQQRRILVYVKIELMLLHASIVVMCLAQMLTLSRLFLQPSLVFYHDHSCLQ